MRRPLKRILSRSSFSSRMKKSGAKVPQKGQSPVNIGGDHVALDADLVYKEKIQNKYHDYIPQSICC